MEKTQTTCMWCGEPLKFEAGRGWVHQNGSIYMMRCKDCGFKGGNSVHCPRCGSKNYVDDHCALPDRSH